MADRILMTPEELRGAATFVEEKQEEIRQAVDALKLKIINDVCSRWEGASQQAFIAQFEDIYNKVLNSQVPEILTGVATELRTAAETIERADQEIASAMNNG